MKLKDFNSEHILYLNDRFHRLQKMIFLNFMKNRGNLYILDSLPFHNG